MAIDEEHGSVLETAAGLKYFAPPHEAAWIGILQVHAELTRAVDRELTVNHGLTFSSYDILARVAHAPEQHLRMSQLAEQSQLSLSRVSRVIDLLEQRGLVARRSCESDSRVVHATITDAGLALVAEAQETFFGVVEERFLGRLECAEVMQLGRLMGRLVEAPLGSSCPGAAEEPPAS